MIRQQRYTPDTCTNPATGDACSLIEEWDDAVDPVSRAHSMIRVEKQCSRHAALDPATCYARNYEENRRKNVSFSIAQSVKASLPLAAFKWSFDQAGILSVDFGDELTTQQKTQLRNALNIQFGPNKATVI